MEKKKRSSVPVITLGDKDALKYFLGMDQYCTTELPEYFNFEPLLDYAKSAIGNKTLEQCLATNVNPMTCEGININVMTNKDGRYGVRPLTLANPFLYYMLARDICSEDAWRRIQECFKLFQNKHFAACAIPMVKAEDKPEQFRGATSILNWWDSMEQTSIELSLKYRYMFVTDITNCFGQVNPESISWALARKGTEYETAENNELASNIQTLIRTMQQGRNMGIPQGSALFGFISEIILGYADMLFSRKIEEAQATGLLPQTLEYKVLRYVDDYRIFCNDRDALETLSYILQHILEQFNFRMNTSKTKISSEIIADSIKSDKAYYIFNTPIESKQTYRDENGYERKEQGYDFDGFQKHLLFIYEFSRRFPNGGQLKNQLSAFSKRIEKQLSPQIHKNEVTIIDLETGKTSTEIELKEYSGHLWENISAMVAIAVEIAANNVSVAHYALKVASQMLADMKLTDMQKKKDIIQQIYQKLRHQPNSAFLQVWLQNITHTTDEWSSAEIYDMPLCKLVAKQSVDLWNNSWLKEEIADKLPIGTIVNREVLAKTGQVITFKEKRQYDSMSY